MDWNNSAVESLKELYVEFDIPSDTLIADENKLIQFTKELISRASELEGIDKKEVATKLLKVRKSGKLPTIR